MSSYIDLGDGRIQMPFGILGGITALEHYDTGELKSAKLRERNVILTHAGELIPVYTETPRRKNKPSVKFYRNGLVGSVAFEEQQEVITPIGELPAELITFYESGELHRVFPVDGQISGFWTEEDEKRMNIPLSFDLGFTAFTAMVSSICFYASGDIKSITLFPGETISVDTPCGKFKVRHGFSLYESGELRSLEPEFPVKVKTEIGTLVAFDPLSQGVTADSGSVTFAKDGKPLAFSTVSNRIAVQTEDEHFFSYEPVPIPHPCSDEQLFYSPIRIAFNYINGTAVITDTLPHVYPMSATHFTVSPFVSGELGCSPADCASCSLCS